jgi:hypothetical protein
MTFLVCVIHENNPSNTQSYPYKDCVLIHDKRTGVFRFPEQDGIATDSRDGILEMTDEVQKAFTTIPSDRKAEFLTITQSPDGMDILVLIVKDSYPLPLDSTYPIILQDNMTVVRAIMDEIRQGRVCHTKVDSHARNLFFSTKDLPSKDNVPSTTPYFYEPASDSIANTIALVRATTDTPVDILHAPGYYRIPMIGYHGTSESFVGTVIDKGLQPTKRNGMYGNDAFYFGSFFKAVRYTFRDSGYAEMPYRSALYKSSRPAGFLELQNTAHIPRKSTEIKTDLIRDAPSLIRFVLFVRNPVFMPSNSRSLDTPKLLKSLPAKTDNRFLVYHKNTKGTGKTIYSRDYINSQVGEPLFKDGSKGVDAGVNEDEDLMVNSDSTREETTLRLFRAIHVATRPAFA